MSKSCPTCGSKASGNFCSQCGGSLESSRMCAACGNTIPQGGRFCNMCGVQVAVAGGAGASMAEGGKRNLPWFVAGAALLALIVAIVAPRFTTPDPGASTAAPPITGPTAPNPGAIDLSQMTPEEAAVRLYNRVMEYVTAGDTAQALAFAPMAIAAYEMVPQIDADGLYHVAILHLVNNDADAARATADRILADAPDHLFGLFTAAQAEEMRGNADEAASLYRRFLESYDAEMATQRQEYTEHANVLPGMIEEAESKAAGAAG